jgi:hypothetical protein
MKIFFFYKRNPVNGELTGDIVDESDEKSAFNCYKTPRLFAFIGWSDGRFMSKVRIPAVYDDKTKMMKKSKKSDVKRIKDAAAAELEFAKTNPDRTPPRDMNRKGLNGQPLDNPQLLAALGKM